MSGIIAYMTRVFGIISDSTKLSGKLGALMTCDDPQETSSMSMENSYAMLLRDSFA